MEPWDVCQTGSWCSEVTSAAVTAAQAQHASALWHRCCLPAGVPKPKQATVLNRKRVSPTNRPDDSDNALLNRSFPHGKVCFAAAVGVSNTCECRRL